jgi:uncharacterized protein involved in high-affinity Fe2+ transport
MKEIELINPNEAFLQAIANQILSANEADQKYAGAFMYMHTKDGIHYFKNIITRKYGFDYQTILDATKSN